jgi:hypothetical protein
MTTDPQTDRRERYMAALRNADPYALVERRDDLARFADAVMAVADAEQPAAVDRAAVLHDLADRADPQRPEVSWFGDFGHQVGEWIRQQADYEKRRTADEAGEQQPDPKCVCGHPTRLHHEDVCLLTDCECADSLEISALPEALEAVLTKRFTELGNPFAEMRVHEQGPDGWPSSRLVSPHMVAEALRELLRRMADEEQPS